MTKEQETVRTAEIPCFFRDTRGGTTKTNLVVTVDGFGFVVIGGGGRGNYLLEWDALKPVLDALAAALPPTDPPASPQTT